MFYRTVLPIRFGDSNKVVRINENPHNFLCLVCVRKTIFSIKVFVTLLDYLKIPQVAILGDLHV
jgi:hypothetical protein